MRVAIATSIALFASLSASAEASPWQATTASTLDKGGVAVGLFAPLRYGITDDLELSTHPISAFWNGNFALKKGWGEFGGWEVATRHGFSYPTRLLQAFARSGAGGLLPPDAEIPHTIALDTRVFASRALSEETTMTLGARLSLGVALGEGSWGPMEIPLAYARTEALRNGAAANLSATFEGALGGSFGWFYSLEGWYLPGAEGSWSVEETAAVAWSSESGRVAIQGGAVGVAGAYPYGFNWHVLPKFDVNLQF